MGKFILRTCRVEVNAVDLSDHVSSVEVSLAKDDVDTTNFGTGNRERVHGLRNDKFTINFQQDFAAANVDATLYPLFNNETSFAVKVRPTSGAISATNPEYLATTCLLMEYQPMNGKVGDLSDTSVTIVVNGTGIDRDITP